MTYLRVFDIDGGAFSVMQADEGALEAAMQRLFNGTDNLVTVRLLDGDECVFRASHASPAGWSARRRAVGGAWRSSATWTRSSRRTAWNSASGTPVTSTGILIVTLVVVVVIGCAYWLGVEDGRAGL